ncbi:MAG: hypothetical protein UY71_C0032G0001, partial [Parcubacteria group bacterium GW2011_GWB1_52_7]
MLFGFVFFAPLEVAAPRSSGLATLSRARLLTGRGVSRDLFQYATRLAYSQHTNKLEFVGMLFEVVGDGVADFADLFQFAFRFQLIQIAHGGTARNPELLSDFRIT